MGGLNITFKCSTLAHQLPLNVHQDKLQYLEVFVKYDLDQ